jgi:hypothetical protein
MEITRVDEMQLGQRVRVTRIKDSMGWHANENKPVLLHPAGEVYEGVIDRMNVDDEYFVITVDDGKGWSFHLPNDTLKVTLVS